MNLPFENQRFKYQTELGCQHGSFGVFLEREILIFKFDILTISKTGKLYCFYFEYFKNMLQIY